MKKNNTFIFNTFGMFVLSAFISPAIAAEVSISYDVEHDTSVPLRDEPPVLDPNAKSFRHSLQTAPRPYVPSFSAPPVPKSFFNQDTPRPSSNSAAAPFKLSDLPIKGFQGVGVGLGDYQPLVSPPDTNGSVGRTQYVQWVNASFAVFDKATGKVAPGFPKPGSALFSGFGGECETSNRGDGIVKYDQLADRWVITKFAFSDRANGPWLQCIAVSTTPDATGAYNRYAYQFNSLNDYGKLGMWSDAYYLTLNMVGPTIWGPRLCAVDRNAMLAGKPSTMLCIQLDFLLGGSAVLPADLDGKTLPPPGTPEYFVSLQPPNALKLFKFHTDFAVPSQSTVSSPITIPVQDYVMPCANAAGDDCVPQPNTLTKLDAASDRLMHRLAYRQFQDYGALVVTHTVQGKAPLNASVIRWYEVRIKNENLDPVVYQQGNHGIVKNGWGFMGSIAMDKAGNIAFGYSKSSTTLYPSIGISARLASAPLGQLSISTNALIGTAAQEYNSRWGDYSGMSIDPVDDCTFWYTTEYMQKGAYMWSTYINYFKMPNCV